jgi:ribosome biogenesis GTPase
LCCNVKKDKKTLTATVYKSTGSFYLATDELGRVWNCRIRGKFKIDKQISSTNPIAVGDEVALQIESEQDGTAIITEIASRRNYIVRTSPHNRHHKHIVGANLDQALLVATIQSPKTSMGFIDRFLVTAEAYHIPAIIVFNKSDLMQDDALAEYHNRKAIYEAIGYTVYAIAATQNIGIDVLRKALHHKTTLFSGHSGVGKSTVINTLLPQQHIKVQEVSDWSGKGQHTTTFAQMYDLPDGGRIIDTPGVKEFGIVDMGKEELSHYFPEMRSRLHHCKFNNCVHINEPGCAIKAAVLASEISVERYDSYLNIMDSLA